MYISYLNLTNFRNYHNLSLDMPAGLLTFFGNNAQGKSNLLEAVYLLSIAKAYRATSDQEAISKTAHEDQGHSQVLGLVHRKQDKVRIMVDMRLERLVAEGMQPRLRKDLRVNGIHVPASGLIGVVNAVLFDAEDIQLISGPPATRRRYLDILICQMDTPYLRALQKYQRVVYQRNHLLRLIRDHRAQPKELDFWNETIVKEGSYITLMRHRAVEELRKIALEIHRDLTESAEGLNMDYLPSINLESDDMEQIQESFSHLLKNGQDKELALGSSQWGPHRDDLRLILGGMDAADYASRGQTRTLALTLKLAEGALLERQSGESPILLLDDVLSELDTYRRRRLLEYISNSEQAIVSTTDLNRIEEPFLSLSNKFLVQNGGINAI